MSRTYRLAGNYGEKRDRDGSICVRNWLNKLDCPKANKENRRRNKALLGKVDADNADDFVDHIAHRDWIT